MRQIVGGILMAVLAALSFAATAQQFPSKSIRLIVPFPPAGLTDVSARVIANGMTTRLGQTVVIDNRPGGNTMIGLRAVADSPPDGYTLGYIPSGITQVPYMSKSWDLDPLKRLAPISQVLEFPLALAISPKKYPNVKTLSE